MDPPFDMTSQVTSGSEGNHRSRSNLIRFQQDSRYKMNIGPVDITISFKDQSVYTDTSWSKVLQSLVYRQTIDGYHLTS
uniref:Uncharacterized protein n=1 Tax=Solanum tuberosum TaxID=4113 RepID=M1D2Y1_SOLTU